MKIFLVLVTVLLTMTAYAVTLTDKNLEIRFDDHGNITGVKTDGRNLTIRPSPLPISLQVNGKWWHEQSPPVTPVKINQSSNQLWFTVYISDFRIVVHYILHRKGILQKQVSLVYEGKQELKVDGVLFWLPSFTVGDDSVALSPSFDFLRLPLTKRLKFNIDMGTGAWCAVYSPSKRLGIATLFYSETEYFSVNAETIDIQPYKSKFFQALSVYHWLGVQDRVYNGWTADLGDQFFIVVKGSEHDLLSKIWDAYDAVKVHCLHDTPEDVFEGSVYSTWTDYRNLKRLLPHLKRLQVKTIWLLPYTRGIYAPLDYYEIRPEVGSPDDLKALVEDAHKLKMLVLLDLIPHGPRPESMLAKQHPEWIVRDEQGQLVHWWGCYAFDYADEGWQNYMAEVASYFAKEFKIDGWRVDVAGGGPYNWAVTNKPDLKRRPSQSGLWGGLRILDLARSAVKSEQGKAIFYPEASGPPFIAHSDIVYEFPLLFILRRLPYMDASEFVPNLQRWLQHQRYTFPKSGTKRLVRFIENHDFPGGWEVWGISLTKALFALIACLEGIPFLFEGQDVGATPFIEKVMTIRSSLPELLKGEADYLDTPLQTGNGKTLPIFCVHRFLRRHHTVALVNLSSQPNKLKVQLPTPMRQWKKVGDAWTGKVFEIRGGAITLTVPAYEPAFLTDVTRISKFHATKVARQTVNVCPVSIADDGSISIGDLAFGSWYEGEFKVAPGKQMKEIITVRHRKSIYEGKVALKRQIGRHVRAVANVRWHWQPKTKNSWNYEAHWKFLTKTKLARYDLVWQIKFINPKMWRVLTTEGIMEDIFVVRNNQSQLVWDSFRILPLPQSPSISIQLSNGQWWTLTRWRANNLKVFVNPDETMTVEIAPDSQGKLSIDFSVDTFAPNFRQTFTSFDGPRFILKTSNLQIAVARNLGGLPVRAFVHLPKSKECDVVLTGAELYSDYGIFYDKRKGQVSLCRIPERIEFSDNRINFQGVLSGIGYFGRWEHLSPRIYYRLSYKVEREAIAFHAIVRPEKPLRKVRAFLAFRLDFIGVGRIFVNTDKGLKEVKERGERDWQSRQLPLSVRAPKILIHTKSGFVVLDKIRGDLQNCFVLRDKQRCSVFFAWLDGELTDVSDEEQSLQFQLFVQPFP